MKNPKKSRSLESSPQQPNAGFVSIDQIWEKFGPYSRVVTALKVGATPSRDELAQILRYFAKKPAENKPIPPVVLSHLADLIDPPAARKRGPTLTLDGIAKQQRRSFVARQMVKNVAAALKADEPKPHGGYKGRAKEIVAQLFDDRPMSVEEFDKVLYPRGPRKRQK